MINPSCWVIGAINQLWAMGQQDHPKNHQKPWRPKGHPSVSASLNDLKKKVCKVFNIEK
jgi:hypothetical protein